MIADWLRPVAVGLVLSGAGGPALAQERLAQQQLPGIVVPVAPAEPPKTSAPAPAQAAVPAAAPKPAPKPQPKVIAKAPPPQPKAAPPTPPATQPPPAQQSPPTTDEAGLPGTLLVRTDAYAPITTIGSREITASPGATLTDSLATKPGITGSSFAPGANRPIIRGLDNYRVRTQENGIGTGDVSAISEDHAIPVDPFAADKVEVIRGPATLRYGSQAVGGVVSAENGRVPSAIPRNGISAETRGGWNSVDNGRDGAFRVTAGAGGVALHADAFKRRTDDYDTPQGRQRNSFTDSEGAAIGASVIWGTGYLGVAYARIDSLYGIPGGEAALTERPRIDMHQDKVISKGEWRVRDHGIETVRLWLGYSIYAHNEVVFDAALGSDGIGSRFTNREHEGRIEAQFLPVATPLGDLKSLAGVQWGDKRTVGASFEGGDNLLEPTTTNMIAAFLFEELRLSQRLRVQGAMRIEHQETKGTGVEDPFGVAALVDRQRAFTPTSGSIGLLYDLPLGVVARLTGLYSERAPQAAELFSKGAHEATGTFEIGNPDLGLEKAKTIELGFARSTSAFRFDASAYYTAYDNFIFKRLTGRQCDDTLASCGGGTELNQLVFAQRDATFYGAELGAQLDIAPIWRGVWGIEGQYDFVQATFGGGANAPRIPPHRLGGGLFYRDDAWRARLLTLHAFRQDTVSSLDPKDTPTNGYTLLNAELSYTWKQDRYGTLAPEMTVGLKADNLLDDDVRNHVSFKKDEVLQPGRTIRLFGSVKFN